MNILGKIDRFLDMTTMYRVVLYGLSLLIVYALLLSGLHVVAFSLWSLLVSFILVVGTALITHKVCEKVWKAPAFIESSFITAFILFFIVAPPQSVFDALWVVGIAMLAIISKYLLAYRHKHFLNPVAIALVVAGACGSFSSIWWVGSNVMFVPVLVVGLLVIKKLRRFSLFLMYVVVSTGVVCANAFFHSASLFEALMQHFISWPTIFFGAIMLSEPSTMPPTKKLQLFYAAFVGVVSSIPFSIGTLFYSTPELALVMGNLFTFTVSTKGRITLRFKERLTLAQDTYEFVFAKDQSFQSEAGQYMEWTLPHQNPDMRGIRRYFTIASSPKDETVRLGVKITEGGSTFKKALYNLKPEDRVYGASVAGDFVLSGNAKEKLVFLAGGIGITPFVSMLRTLAMKGEKRDIVLFYAARNNASLAYKHYLEEVADQVGMRIVYMLNEKSEVSLPSNYRVGMIDEGVLKAELSQYKDRVYYLSGPQVMVTAFTHTLKKMGVSDNSIYRDYFPGFA